MKIQQGVQEKPSSRLERWFRLFFRIVFIILISNFIYFAADIYFLKIPDITGLKIHQGNLAVISGQCTGAKSDRIHFKIDEANGSTTSFTVGCGKNYFQTFSAGIGKPIEVRTKRKLGILFLPDDQIWYIKIDSNLLVTEDQTFHKVKTPGSIFIFLVTAFLMFLGLVVSEKKQARYRNLSEPGAKNA